MLSEALDIAIEIKRIGSFRSLWRETRIATTMFLDSFTKSDVHAAGSDFPNGTIIFVQGFFASSMYYLRFIEFFASHGIRVVCPIHLARNVVSYEQSRQLIRDAVDRIEQETQSVPVLVGHSKGGTDIVGVLGKRSEIEVAVLVGAPLRGSSLGALTSLLHIFHHELGIPVDQDILEEKSILRKITAITTFADNIVPPHEALVPRARGEILRTKSDRSEWDSHTGLAYHARENILKLCQKERKAA